MSAERKPLPRWAVRLAAVLMFPYIVIVGLRELWRKRAER